MGACERDIHTEGGNRNILDIWPDLSDRSQGTFRVKALGHHEICCDDGRASTCTLVILRPVKDLRTELTDPRLAMHKHTMILVQFRLYERYGRHEVLQDIRTVRVVYIDLMAHESLARQVSGAYSLRISVETYLVNRNPPPHRSEHTADLVSLEFLRVQGAREVSNPEIVYNFVHRHFDGSVLAVAD